LYLLKEQSSFLHLLHTLLSFRAIAFAEIQEKKAFFRTRQDRLESLVKFLEKESVSRNFRNHFSVMAEEDWILRERTL